MCEHNVTINRQRQEGTFAEGLTLFGAATFLKKHIWITSCQDGLSATDGWNKELGPLDGCEAVEPAMKLATNQESSPDTRDNMGRGNEHFESLLPYQAENQSMVPDKKFPVTVQHIVSLIDSHISTERLIGIKIIVLFCYNCRLQYFCGTAKKAIILISCLSNSNLHKTT